mmetsp:Transcript_24834/g.53737  ORF Transcript_24834/g.53737 Transcript_24834/m.53737 type:complete len:112 (-) Transcript_24834:1398-1733(-)
MTHWSIGAYYVLVVLYEYSTSTPFCIRFIFNSRGTSLQFPPPHQGVLALARMPPNNIACACNPMGSAGILHFATALSICSSASSSTRPSSVIPAMGSYNVSRIIGHPKLAN